MRRSEPAQIGPAGHILSLFFLAALFMLLFQLEARLISYAYLFHEGILLVESILLGGGLALLAHHLPLLRQHRARLAPFLPLAIFAVLALQLALFFLVNSFVLDVLTFSLLFGLLFLAITRFIELPASTFYGTELLGSVAGVALYALLVSYVLEEQILLGVGEGLGILAIVAVASNVGWPWRDGWRSVLATGMRVGVVLVLGTATLAPLLSQSLPGLISCESYKAPCTAGVGSVPDASFTHLKGRTDAYLAERQVPGRLVGEDGVVRVRTLTARNAGLHSGTTVHRDDLATLTANPFDTEVPALAYTSSSRALVLGAATGANVQSLQLYIENPAITAVEIDRTVEDLYADERFADYLPERDSFDWVYGEARTFLARGNIAGELAAYDVIVAGVETVNTEFEQYVDESTSLAYTREALGTYLDHLAPDGYLLLVQYLLLIRYVLILI